MKAFAASACVLFFFCTLALAQQSPSYDLRESTLNNGGHPSQAVVPASASYRVSLDAIGDGVSLGTISSPSYRVESGFVPAYTPPGEVVGLRFTSLVNLAWDPELSTGTYSLYRDPLTTLPGPYGTCFAGSIDGTAATDITVPVQGSGLFYLVTARNRLREEGTKGRASSGAVRGNPFPCP